MADLESQGELEALTLANNWAEIADAVSRPKPPTELCSAWTMLGGCQYGADCQYRHELGQLPREVPFGGARVALDDASSSTLSVHTLPSRGSGDRAVKSAQEGGKNKAPRPDDMTVASSRNPPLASTALHLGI